MAMATAMFSTSTMVAMIASTMIAMVAAAIAPKMTAAIAMKLRPAATVVTIIKVAIATVVCYPAVVITSPVVGIPNITAVADNNLVMAAPVTGISCSVNIVSYPGVAVINNHFVAMV